MVIVGAVVVGGYFILKSSPQETETNPAVTGENSADLETINPGGTRPADEKKMAFSEFIKQGGSYKCEVKQYLSDIDNSGTVYMSGGNIRGEFSTIAEGRTMSTTFIVKDGYSYTWSSLLPNMGFKTKAVETVGADAVTENSGTYGWNATQIGDYNCEPWSADASKFIIPTDITFKDVSA